MEAVKRYGILTVGSVVLGISDYIFKFQNHFSFGGVSGIAVIMSGLLGGSASTYTFVINMLLLVVAFVLLGKEVAMRSAYVSVLYSVTLEVIQYVWPMSEPLTNQPVLELVFCFMIIAVCSAIFFNMNASSGGSDIIALILKKYTNISIGTALLVVDFIVVIVAFFVYGVTVGLFSLAGFLAKSFFIDTVIESLNLCKYFTIISKNAEPICNYINAELNHGATIYDARGAYTKDNKQVVMTVVKREQARNLRNYVHKVDPDAFMMITNSSEIIGKGFDGGNLIAGLGKHFRDVLVSKDPATVQLLEVSAGIKARYAKQAADCQVDFLYEALKIVEQCEMQYKVRMEKRLCIELALIKLCQINELKKKI